MLASTWWALASAIFPGPEPPTYGFRTLHKLPHDRQAFTQGLCYEQDGQVLESTGLYGGSSARRVQLRTGRVLRKEELPVNWFGEGLAFHGKLCWQLLWREGLVLERERETLQLLREVELPPGVEGWGLTHDGSSTLYASDGSSQLRLLDPQSLQTRRVMTVRCGSRELNGINELQWIRGHVWANLWREDRLASIDPNTGKVLFFVNLEPIITKGERRKLGEEEVLNGIAYDARGDRLWVTGKCWPNLFQIAVDEAGVGLGQEPP